MAALSYGLVFTLVDATVKATALLGLAAIVAALLRRPSASVRHFVWALSLGCVLFLPLLSRGLPRWRVPITTPLTHSRPAAEEAPPLADALQPAPRTVTPAGLRTQAGLPPLAAPTSSPAEPQAEVQPPAPLMTTPARPPFALPIPHVPWTVWALLVWASGALLVLARLALGVAGAGRVARASIAVTDGSIAGAAAMAARVMRVERPVTLRQASSPERVTVPLTYGVWRPVIVITANAQDWPEGRLEAALLHEMAHVRRGDWILQVVAQAACALYWFHPLAWLAARRLRAEAEAACDDRVLGAGVPAQVYARHLLDVALCARRSRRAAWGTVAMAQTPRVEERLRAVLAQGLPRRPVTGRTAAGLLTAALLLALPLAALRLSVQGEAVPAAVRLQLRGDFTLRYAATITDLRSRQALFTEYTQIRDQYRQILRDNPHYQPVPDEALKPFAYFLSRRPRTRHVLMTVSARNGHLLFRTEEGSDTFTWVYDGRSSSLNWNGHTGQVDAGLMFGPDYPLPAVGLPRVPLIKAATLLNSSGDRQTWTVDSPFVGAVGVQRVPPYFPAVAHAVSDGGTWKLLDIDDGSQKLQFLRHRRFGGLWVASQMTMTRYVSPLPESPHFSTLAKWVGWIAAHRTPTSAVQYRLLSASSVPLGLVDFDRHAVGRRAILAAYGAGIRRGILRWPSTWRVTPGSVHLGARVQRLTVQDHTAQAVVLEDDRTTVTDSGTGQRRSVRATATFNDFWRLRPYTGDVSKDWVVEKGRAEGQRESVSTFLNAGNTPGAGQPARNLTAPRVGAAGLNFQGRPVVVMDPGHGGGDAGVVTAGGVTEKSLNLEIAQKLRAELERRGAVVYLTRGGDTLLPIMDRLRLAAQHHADYFISLHCDQLPQHTTTAPQRQDTSGQGTVVYYHGQDTTERRLAEDISLGIGQASDLSPSRTASDTTRFMKGFGVLRGAPMPAVLVECGCMDSANDLERLRDPQGQQRLVEGIAEGLIAFRGEG